ncbi:MAG: ABC transporter substrate-binding protein [Chloroflexi bacterium]|nr:ABC transporter substrate-binding protein [Chloroflexota bacterium]
MKTFDHGKMISLAMLVFLLLGPLSAACTLNPFAPQKKDVVEVPSGDLGFLDDMHLYLALEKGYFAEEGIKPNFTRFRSTADAIGPLSTGEIKVLPGGVAIGMFNALARGLPIKIVASRSLLYMPFDSNWWMVRSDLADKIKTAADLKGKKINFMAPGSVNYYAGVKILERGGLTLKDIEPVHLGMPDAVSAMQGKAVDVSIAIEPFVGIMESQGIARRWASTTEFTGPYQVAIVTYNADWAQKSPEQAKSFMVAYIKGMRDYYRAMVGGTNRKEVIEIATRYTAMKDAAQYEKIFWTGTRPNGYVDVANLKDQLALYAKNGLLEGAPADLDKAVDNSFVDYAISKLGRMPE